MIIKNINLETYQSHAIDLDKILRSLACFSTNKREEIIIITLNTLYGIFEISIDELNYEQHITYLVEFMDGNFENIDKFNQ